MSDPIKIVFGDINGKVTCETNVLTKTIENTKEYKDCFEKLIIAFQDLMDNKDITFFNSKNIEDIAKQFLSIFNINDIKNFNTNDINNKIDLIKTYIKSIYNLYHDELLFNMNIVCNIFSIIGNSNISIGNKLSTLTWSNKYDIPIYLLYTSKSIFPEINGDNLIEIINKFKKSTFIIDSLPKVIQNNYIIKNKCHQITDTVLLTPDELNTSNQNLLNIIRDVKSLESLYKLQFTGFGKNPSKDCFIKDDDECKPDIDTSFKNHYENILDNFGNIIRAARDGYYIFHDIILDFIYKINYYKKIRNKINYILNIFNKVVSPNFENQSNILLSKNIIILNIDLLLFKFAYNFFIEQIKVDKFDQFSIHRILSNIANYYIEHSQPNKPYIIIHDQESDVRINLLLFVYMFINILADTPSFYISNKYIKTINIALIVGMTNRKTVICPNEDIKRYIINKIIESTSYHDQILFTINGDGSISDKYGFDIKFSVDNKYKDVQLLNV